MNEAIEHIINRKLAGEDTLADNAVLEEWFAADPVNAGEFELISSYWSARVENTFADTDVTGLVFSKIKNVEKKERNDKRRITALRILSSAAVLAVGVLLALNLSVKGVSHFSHSNHNGTYELELPDGTGMVLGKRSTVSYDSRFGDTGRTVYFKGLGFFDVRHDGQNKFSVRLDGASITVHGTSFTVRAMEGEETITTSLLEGSLSFESGDQRVDLHPGQKLVFDRRDGKMMFSDFDPDVETAWKDNLVRYVSATIPEIMDILEEHYGVKITVEDGDRWRKRLSGTFQAGMAIEQVFGIISYNIPFRWTEQDGNYTIVLP